MGEIAQPRVFPGQQGVEDDAEREEVGAAIHGLGSKLLRGCVPGRAERSDRRQAGVGLFLGDLRDAEVEDLHRILSGPIFGQHQVLELEIPMHDRLRPLVRGHETVACLQREPDGSIDRHRTFVGDHVGEASPVDELHEEVDHTGLDVFLVRRQADDVLRVLSEALHDLRLAQEARTHLLGLRAGHPVDTQDLEGFDPAALHVLDLVDRTE